MTAPIVESPPITLHLCGPSKCEHDYSGWKEFTTEGGCTVGTKVCAKCGVLAIDEDSWL